MTVKTLILIILWYATNCAYNVFNAKIKNANFPIILAFLQICLGLLYPAPLYILSLRRLPTITLNDIFILAPIAISNVIGHTATVIATYQPGGGTFSHVIKASEPVVSVFLLMTINGVLPKPLSALSLIPICYGVAYASTLGDLALQKLINEFTSKTAMWVKNYRGFLKSILNLLNVIVWP